MAKRAGTRRPTHRVASRPATHATANVRVNVRAHMVRTRRGAHVRRQHVRKRGWFAGLFGNNKTKPKNTEAEKKAARARAQKMHDIDVAEWSRQETARRAEEEDKMFQHEARMGQRVENEEEREAKRLAATQSRNAERTEDREHVTHVKRAAQAQRQRLADEGERKQAEALESVRRKNEEGKRRIEAYKEGGVPAEASRHERKQQEKLDELNRKRDERERTGKATAADEDARRWEAQHERERSAERTQEHHEAEQRARAAAEQRHASDEARHDVESVRPVSPGTAG